MAHVSPPNEDALPETIKPLLAMAEAQMGFKMNSLATMAHWPELVTAFVPAAATVLGSGEIDPGLKQMIAAVVSGAAGCRYCQAHTTHNAAENAGVDVEKIGQVWNFQTSDLFDQKEKAALNLALAAGQNPNAASGDHFEALRTHFSEREIVEIVAVIALFGFLNRWNDTMATEQAALFRGRYIRC
jgi:uncharacterized peroxidase-related enzyme